jgi:hypothetical protein
MKNGLLIVSLFSAGWRVIADPIRGTFIPAGAAFAGVVHRGSFIRSSAAFTPEDAAPAPLSLRRAAVGATVLYLWRYVVTTT